MRTRAACSSGKREFFLKKKDDLAVIVSVGTVAVILQVGGRLLRGFGHEGEALEDDVQGLGRVQTNKIYFLVFLRKTSKKKRFLKDLHRVQAKK
jgi:hypothetical protein